MKIYCKDNLELLKELNDNSIDLIYSDILYGTNRNFGEYIDISINEVEEHYIPRIKEMYRVLKNTGTIVLQMDPKISYKLRYILNDIFGEENFRNEIIWAYNSAPRKKGCFGFRHDVILRYSKSNEFTFNEIREPYSLTAPRGYAKEKYYNPDGKVLGDVWNIPILGQNDKTERTGYPTQKPLQLVNTIINYMSNEGDLVADFYLGSGTTAESCLINNRHFIGCDISENAVNICKNRLNKYSNKLF